MIKSKKRAAIRNVFVTMTETELNSVVTIATVDDKTTTERSFEFQIKYLDPETERCDEILHERSFKRVDQAFDALANYLKTSYDNSKYHK